MMLACYCCWFQVFEQLALVAEDPHPDAYAARIKLWLAFQVHPCPIVMLEYRTPPLANLIPAALTCTPWHQASKHAMPCPWSIVSELVAYAELAPHVSAACRLSIEEEDKLLNSIAVPDRFYPPPLTAATHSSKLSCCLC